MIGGKYRSSRPSPSQSATLFKKGHTKKGNDGNIWEVSITTNGVKRWKKTSKKTSRKSSRKNSRKNSRKSKTNPPNEIYKNFYNLLNEDYDLDTFYKKKLWVNRLKDNEVTLSHIKKDYIFVYDWPTYIKDAFTDLYNNGFLTFTHPVGDHYHDWSRIPEKIKKSTQLKKFITNNNKNINFNNNQEILKASIPFVYYTINNWWGLTNFDELHVKAFTVKNTNDYNKICKILKKHFGKNVLCTKSNIIIKADKNTPVLWKIKL